MGMPFFTLTVGPCSVYPPLRTASWTRFPRYLDPAAEPEHDVGALLTVCVAGDSRTATPVVDKQLHNEVFLEFGCQSWKAFFYLNIRNVLKILPEHTGAVENAR